MAMDKWVVFISTAVRLFFISGCIKANGVILEEFVDKLETNHSLVAWAFSLQHGLAYMFTPVTELLLRVFSNRQIAVVGGFVVGLSYIYCGCCVLTDWQLVLAFTASGAGFGLASLPSYLVLEQHFQEDFPTALSLSATCNYIGIGVLPLFLQYLKNKYGTESGLILLGAILWHLIPCGLGLLSPKSADGEQTSEESDEPIILCQAIDNINMREKSFFQKYFSYFSSMYHHRNFTILIGVDFVAGLVFTSWALFLVSLGTTKGFTGDEAVFLSTAGGVGGIVGVVACALLFHYKKVNAYTGCLIPGAIVAITLIACAVLNEFSLLSILTFMTGFGMGIFGISLLGLIPKLVCRRHFRQAVVINFLADGIAFQLGGFISGIIQDSLGSTEYVFLFDGLLCFLMFPWILIWACNDEPVTTECLTED
ncbi:monocarboxylate transporter 14-like isoform X2 [Apostichopus japonicus]